MTVTELRKELEELETQGKGDCEVIKSGTVDAGNWTNVEYEDSVESLVVENETVYL